VKSALVLVSVELSSSKFSGRSSGSEFRHNRCHNSTQTSINTAWCTGWATGLPFRKVCNHSRRRPPSNHPTEGLAEVRVPSWGEKTSYGSERPCIKARATRRKDPPTEMNLTRSHHGVKRPHLVVKGLV